MSHQWRSVLRALAQELHANGTTEGLKTLFFVVGQRMARDVEAEFESINTLSDLQSRLNSHWEAINWGWVALHELEDSIRIEHQAAPLAEAFGEAAMPWAVGLLEGFYDAVFKVLGAGDSMRVHAMNEPLCNLQITLRFEQYAS